MSKSQTKIELLAPAKDLSTAKAAIDWGADALYIGGPKFGARHAAGNTVEDIAEVVKYARPFGVRVYVTLNTLVFESELAEAERVAREVIAAGVDALIVQDMAYLEMGLEGVELHASTQTFNVLPEKVAFLANSGFSRIILERGLSLSQIKEIRSATDAELECFVHGAICVSYSGHCWMSRSTGPRSGNRGDCSQPCRQTWDLVDEAGNAVVKGKYLLSLRDLDLSTRLGDLLDAGVASFKIEGRLKDEIYVKNTVGYYRQRLDEELARRPHLSRASVGRTVMDVSPDLSKTFTRGRSEYVFNGKKRGIASLDTNKAVGDLLGRVAKVGNGWFQLDRAVQVAPGDGLCFIEGGELTGTNVNKVESGRIFPNRTLQLASGTEIYRNHDHAFENSVKKSRTNRVLGVSASIKVDGRGVSLTYTDEEGVAVTITREEGLDVAKDSAKVRPMLEEQLRKSGVEPFVVDSVAVEYDGVSFVPLSLLGGLRREGLDMLLSARVSRQPVRNITVADESYPFIADRVDGSDNVTNSLAERFYRRHGVKEVERGFDSKDSMDGVCVMRTPYCIRRELGQCLKEKPTLRGRLWIERGAARYALEFDCARCEMAVIKDK